MSKKRFPWKCRRDHLKKKAYVCPISFNSIVTAFRRTVLYLDDTSRQTSTPNSSHNTTLRIFLVDSMHASSLTPPSCEESEMGRYFDTQWPRNLFRAMHYSVLEQGLFHVNNNLMI